MPDTIESGAVETPHCYRHSNRETLLSCSNCERPICTSCMTQAAVGVRCPECAGGGSGAARSIRRVQARSDLALATTAIVALNLLVFLAEMAQGVGFSRSITQTAIGLDGAIYGPLIADGEWWRLVTGGFLHAGFIHVGFNMYLLWILGGALERYAGTGRFVAIYAGSLLWGSAGALLFAPDTFTVGASGGVFGVMAAVFLLERQRGVTLLGSSVGVLLLINLGITFVIPGISVGGHVGGLLGGAAVAFVLSGFGRGHLAYGRIGAAGWGAVAALIAGAVVASLLFV